MTSVGSASWPLALADDSRVYGALTFSGQRGRGGAASLVRALQSVSIPRLAGRRRCAAKAASSRPGRSGLSSRARRGDAGNDENAADGLNESHRLVEEEPRERSCGDRLDEDDEGRERRRQVPQRIGEEALAARVADDGEPGQRCPAGETGREDPVAGKERDGEEGGRRYCRGQEDDPSWARAPAGAADGEEIHAEEERGGEAEEVAVEMIRPERGAGADQRRGAAEAEEKAAHRLAADRLADEQPRAERDPDRRQRRQERRVGDAGVKDGEVPEDQVATEEEAGGEDRSVEPQNRRLRFALGARFVGRPEIEERQGARDPPEGARERADLGKADEDRRDAHRQRAEKERGEGRGIGAIVAGDGPGVGHDGMGGRAKGRRFYGMADGPSLSSRRWTRAIRTGPAMKTRITWLPAIRPAGCCSSATMRATACRLPMAASA